MGHVCFVCVCEREKDKVRCVCERERAECDLTVDAEEMRQGNMSERDSIILAQNAALNLTEDQEDDIIPLWKPEV